MKYTKHNHFQEFLKIWTMVQGVQCQEGQDVNVLFSKCELLQMLIGTKKSFSHDTNMINALEVLFSQKLMIACNQNKQERGTQKSANIFHNLGKIYRKRSPRKLSLIKSAILYNAALVRKPENVLEIEKDIEELISHVLLLAGAKNDKANITEMTSVLKNMIYITEKFRG